MYIHPDPALDVGLEFPRISDFEVVVRDHGKGKAVYTKTGHARGTIVARFTGSIVPYRTQHSLQLNPDRHVVDMHFAGYMAHACSPNVFVDMQQFEVWALVDIAPGEILSMDYAATEDELFRQFACSCGSACCRRWVTGRKEQADAEGMRHLETIGFEVNARAQA